MKTGSCFVFSSQGFTFLVLALCFNLTVGSAQITFQRTYGGTSNDRGFSVQQTSDGGYIIAGRTDSFGAGSADVYLVKMDSSGDTLWTRTYGGTAFDYGRSVQQTSDGGYIIAGYTDSFGWQVYLVKTNSSGDTLWTRVYGGASGDIGYSVQQTSDSGYIIAGWTWSFGAGWRDNVYLVKTNSSGDTLWTRAYGDTNYDGGNSVQQTSDGGYIIAGGTLSFGAGSGDVYLLKTNSLGDTLWTRTYGGTGDDYGSSVQQTSDSGYIIAGSTASFGAGNYDMYLVKTNSLGDTLWTRKYGGASGDIGQSVQQTSDSGYIIAGYTGSFGAGSWDAYLVRTNSSGDTLWTRTYGGTDIDGSFSVQQTSDGGYVIAGYTHSFGAGSDDVYLVKTQADGLVSVQDDRNLMTAGFALLQNYPNPFNPMTTISFDLPSRSFVSLRVFDVLGREVSVLVSAELPPGKYSQQWQAVGLASGIYFYRLQANSFIETKKLVLLR